MQQLISLIDLPPTLFANYIKQIGVDLRLGQAIEKITHSEDGQAMVVMKDGEEIVAPCLFYSMGRIANVEGMSLEEAGIELDDMSNIPVNTLFQTACSHIYAAGDVIGPPGLASTSMEQIFNYPTFAEGFRIAALNGLNKVQSDTV